MQQQQPSAAVRPFKNRTGAAVFLHTATSAWRMMLQHPADMPKALKRGAIPNGIACACQCSSTPFEVDPGTSLLVLWFQSKRSCNIQQVVLLLSKDKRVTLRVMATCRMPSMVISHTIKTVMTNIYVPMRCINNNVELLELCCSSHSTLRHGT